MASAENAVPAMKGFTVILLVGLLSPTCRGLPAEKSESVVSVYTTQSSTRGTGPPLDVYHQIANNIAEKITSPIYRFLGINTTKPEQPKRSWDNVELLDDDISGKTDVKPIDNSIIPPRDIEELSSEAASKTDRKPEKITLYSSYLPSDKIELIDQNDTEDPFTLDDVDDVETETGREGPLIYILELFASFFQMLWGGFLSLFNPTSSFSHS